MLLTSTNSGTKVVTPGMISMVRTRPKSRRFPANSIFAKAYPAIEQNSRFPSTQATATSVLFRKYSPKFCFDSRCSKLATVGDRGSQELGWATISPVGFTEPRNIQAKGASVARRPSTRAQWRTTRAVGTRRDGRRSRTAGAVGVVVAVMSGLRSGDAELQEAQQSDRDDQHVGRGRGQSVIPEAELLVGVVADRRRAVQGAAARHDERLLEELEVADAEQNGDDQRGGPEQ